jgi:Flp pilus assembly protein TadD
LYDESELSDKHVDEAIRKLSVLSDEMPGDIDAILARGDILRIHNRYKEAVEAYSTAAGRVKKLEKQHWVLFFSRGACYERLGQWTEAEADLKKALELSPGEPEALNYLGYSWLTKNQNLVEARKMIESAYEARPEDPHIIDSMGYALYIGADYGSAAEYFQQALERTPDDPVVNDHLGDTYWKLGRKTEAKYQWNRALANEKDEAVRHQISEKLEKGIPQKASEAHATNDKKDIIQLPPDE